MSCCRRHPNLIIDDCASGGRRIDLETISRSIASVADRFCGPYRWRTNATRHGLLQWVPLNTTAAGDLSTHNEYKMRSSMTAGLCYGLFSAGDAPQPKANYQNFPLRGSQKVA